MVRTDSKDKSSKEKKAKNGREQEPNLPAGDEKENKGDRLRNDSTDPKEPQSLEIGATFNVSESTRSAMT